MNKINYYFNLKKIRLKIDDNFNEIIKNYTEIFEIIY